MNSYMVAYKLGNTYGKVYVDAHDKIQAGEVARIQIQATMHSRRNFTVLKVLQSGEVDPDRDEAKRYLTKKA